MSLCRLWRSLEGFMKHVDEFVAFNRRFRVNALMLFFVYWQNYVELLEVIVMIKEYRFQLGSK